MNEERRDEDSDPVLGADRFEADTHGSSAEAGRGVTGLGGFVVLFMTAAAALGTSTIYVLQPAVGDVAASIGTAVPDIGIALAWGPIGYMIGLAVIVSLVDRCLPRLVLCLQFAVLASGLMLSSLVVSASQLALLVAVTGACSVVGAGMTTLVGRLAEPLRRATTLGVVTAGISVGILAGRVVGGSLAEALGWDVMLRCFAVACAVFGLGCLMLIPKAPRTAPMTGYLATLRSVPGLFVRHPALRIAAIRGASWFFAFCAVWSGLAVMLVQPPYAATSEQVGLYALAGLSGLVATPIAGRRTDRVGARRVVLTGLVLALAAVIPLGFVLPGMAATMICLAVFDAGLFAAQVANQSTVLDIDPAAPARFNSGYMLAYFIGGSLGTAFGAAGIGWFGWTLTTVLSGVMVVLAIAVTLLWRGARPASELRS